MAGPGIASPQHQDLKFKKVFAREAIALAQLRNSWSPAVFGLAKERLPPTMERTMPTHWLAKLAVVVGLALLPAAAVAQSQKDGQDQWQFKQIKLTDKQVRDFILVQKQLAPLASKLEGAGDQPDPALQKQ